MSRVEASFLCECEYPEPFVYGNFDPPCYVCRKCGLNVTERVHDGGILDTSGQCRELLGRFLRSLRQIQEKVESLDGTHYGCFLFEYSDCLPIDSPVCEVCRRLDKCGMVAMWKGDSNARDI